jgi:hypothetical protein
MAERDSPPYAGIGFGEVKPVAGPKRASKSPPSSVAGRRIEIHPAALAELKSALEWYRERSEPAAQLSLQWITRHCSGNRVHQDVGRPGGTIPADSSCSDSLSRSLAGRRMRACKCWHSLMDAGARDTGRNGCSVPEGRAEQNRVKAPTPTSKSMTLGWATRPDTTSG